MCMLKTLNSCAITRKMGVFSKGCLHGHLWVNKNIEKPPAHFDDNSRPSEKRVISTLCQSKYWQLQFYCLLAECQSISTAATKWNFKNKAFLSIPKPPGTQTNVSSDWNILKLHCSTFRNRGLGLCRQVSVAAGNSLPSTISVSKGTITHRMLDLLQNEKSTRKKKAWYEL